MIFWRVIYFLLMFSPALGHAAVACPISGDNDYGTTISLEMEGSTYISNDISIPEVILIFDPKTKDVTSHSANHCVVHNFDMDKQQDVKNPYIRCSKDGEYLKGVFYKYKKGQYFCVRGCTKHVPKTLTEDDCNSEE